MPNDVSNVFVKKIVNVLTHHGADIDAVLGNAGVDRSGIFSDRLPAAQYSSLWRAAALELDDEFLGQDSCPMTAGTFAMICQIAIQSETLGEALQKIVHLFCVTLSDIEISLVAKERVAELTLSNSRVNPIFAHEIALGLIYDVASWLIDERLPLTCLEFAYPQPSYSGEYRRYYGASAEYDRGKTRLLFSTRLLRRSVNRDTRALREYLGAKYDDLIVQYHHGTTPLHRFVRATLRSSPPDRLPSLSSIAAQLGVGNSTLKRHLRNEGHTFLAIQQQVRLERALQYLRLQNKSTEAIAFDLGFSGASEFRRAFKVWTSNSPTSFRRRVHDSGIDEQDPLTGQPHS